MCGHFCCAAFVFLLLRLLSSRFGGASFHAFKARAISCIDPERKPIVVFASVGPKLPCQRIVLGNGEIDSILGCALILKAISVDGEHCNCQCGYRSHSQPYLCRPLLKPCHLESKQNHLRMGKRHWQLCLLASSRTRSARIGKLWP